MTRVLVSHPHVAAVAAGLAETLEREGKLAAFATGIAFARDGRLRPMVDKLAERYPLARNRVLPGIPAAHLQRHAFVEAGARLLAGSAGKRIGLGVSLYNALFVAHDAAVALHPWPRDTQAVYAYEDGALRTFQRARRAGISRIWDLPLPHYRTISQVLRAEFDRWPGAAVGPPHREPDWKQKRKDEELALADQVSVASSFTKQSLEAVGTRQPIAVAPYGFPCDQFQPRSSAPRGRFRVLSVGTHDLRKGTPYLLEAWKQAALPDAELHLVGPLRLAKGFLDGYAGSFKHWPHVPKASLAEHYAAADLLAFPTLGDGFGLVIQEAMCTGTPVVTTPCGGGPECITDGRDGWIVPPRDVDALVARFREAAADRDRLAAMGSAARLRAERWSWADSISQLIRALGI